MIGTARNVDPEAEAQAAGRYWCSLHDQHPDSTCWTACVSCEAHPRTDCPDDGAGCRSAVRELDAKAAKRRRGRPIAVAMQTQREIIRARRRGIGATHLARKHGVSRVTIHRILRGG